MPVIWDTNVGPSADIVVVSPCVSCQNDADCEEFEEPAVLVKPFVPTDEFRGRRLAGVGAGERGR